MRELRIRHVKDEIRVLGVAVKNHLGGGRLHVVGVVYRGGRWLDGVMRTTAPGPDVTDRLVEMITSSPHHPQIRVLILSEELIEVGASIDPYRLSTGVSRPVIALSKDGWPASPDPPSRADTHNFIWERAGGSLAILSIGLKSRDASRIIEVSTRDGKFPEALRVAGLVASAVAGCPQA